MSLEEGLVERIEQQAKRIAELEAILTELRQELYNTVMFVARLEKNNEPVVCCEVSVPVRLFDDEDQQTLLQRLQESEDDPLPDLDKYFQ